MFLTSPVYEDFEDVVGGAQSSSDTKSSVFLEFTEKAIFQIPSRLLSAPKCRQARQPSEQTRYSRTSNITRRRADSDLDRVVKVDSSGDCSSDSSSDSSGRSGSSGSSGSSSSTASNYHCGSSCSNCSKCSTTCECPQECNDFDEEAIKDWIMENCYDQIRSILSVKRTEQLSIVEKADRQLLLLDKVTQAQRGYFVQEAANVVFGNLLDLLLRTMDSEYGFIGEVKYEEDGTMYLQTHAITNIAWNAATREFYDNNIEFGLKFTNLNSLFGKVMTSAQCVIANNPSTHPDRAGIPEGHPPLNHFLGIPFFFPGTEREISGMVGIANKPGGYSQDDVDFLEPILVTCSNLIQAYRTSRQNEFLINRLEDLVAVRTKELELANQKVVEAAKMQIEHFACMSHEIRTPLNCVIGMSSLLQETELTPAQMDSLDMIVKSGDLLMAVVNDVLDYSKLQTNKMTLEIVETNLQDTLEAVVHSIESKARDKQLALDLHYDYAVPNFVKTDPKRLQQILYNLLGNAIKFSKPNSHVELSVFVCEHDVVNTTPIDTTSSTANSTTDNTNNTDKESIIPPFSSSSSSPKTIRNNSLPHNSSRSKIPPCESFHGSKAKQTTSEPSTSSNSNMPPSTTDQDNAIYSDDESLVDSFCYDDQHQYQNSHTRKLQFNRNIKNTNNTNNHHEFINKNSSNYSKQVRTTSASTTQIDYCNARENSHDFLMTRSSIKTSSLSPKSSSQDRMLELPPQAGVTNQSCSPPSNASCPFTSTRPPTTQCPFTPSTCQFLPLPPISAESSLPLTQTQSANHQLHKQQQNPSDPSSPMVFKRLQLHQELTSCGASENLDNAIMSMTIHGNQSMTIHGNQSMTIHGNQQVSSCGASEDLDHAIMSMTGQSKTRKMHIDNDDEECCSVTSANHASASLTIEDFGPASTTNATESTSSPMFTKYHLKFVIKDYGKGIARKDFSKIFQPFQQVNGQSAATNVQEGTGLGLAITSRLVKALGGSISVDSDLGKWSQFTVDLPLLGKGPVDMLSLSQKLHNNIRIYLVCSDDTKTQVKNLYQSFQQISNVDFMHYTNCDLIKTEPVVEMTAATKETSKARNEYALVNVYIIQEDLYNADVYQKASQCSSSVLITFGPKHTVSEANRHIRSLHRTLPSVFWKTIESCVDDVRATVKAVSFSSPRTKSHLQTKTINDSTLSPTSYERMSVLIAEDNIVNQKVLRQVLIRIGLVDIDIVENGQMAVDQSLTKQYDLILMDMQMPVMDGLEATRIIVDRRDSCSTKSYKPHIVFLTANASREFENTAKDAGGDGYLTKPFTLQTMRTFFQNLPPEVITP